MLQALVRWLLTWLEQKLDPDLQARVQALNKRIDAIEADEKAAVQLEEASARALAESEARRKELDAQLEVSRQQEADLEKALTESNKRIAEIKNEAEAAKKQIDALSDPDAVRGPV